MPMPFDGLQIRVVSVSGHHQRPESSLGMRGPSQALQKPFAFSVSPRHALCIAEHIGITSVTEMGLCRKISRLLSRNGRGEA
jgi:hypothetical protein